MRKINEFSGTTPEGDEISYITTDRTRESILYNLPFLGNILGFILNHEETGAKDLASWRWHEDPNTGDKYMVGNDKP